MSVVASTSDCLKIHQWQTGNLKEYYKPEYNTTNGSIKSISWSRDGTWLLLVPSVGPSEVLNVKENLKLLQTIEDIYQPTYAVFQNSTKRNIAIGTVSGEILLYDIKLRNVKKRFPRASSSIFDFKWNSKDSHIAAACINGDIIIYNNLSSNISSFYKVPKSKTVSAINFHSTKRNLLAAGSEEGIVATWDINTNNTLCYLQVHQAPVTDLIFSPIRSDLLISTGLDRRLEFYDILSQKCVVEVELVSSATSIDFSPCGTYLGVGSPTGNIIIYDTRNFKLPFSAFIAHDGKKICHFFFQKVLSDNSIEHLSITAPEGESERVQSLGLTSYHSTNNKKTDYHGDSFLAALGLDSSGNVSQASLKHDDVRCAQSEEVQQRADGEKIMQLQNTISVFKTSTKQVSSTPKHVIENLPSITESPIVDNAENLLNDEFTLESFKEAVRDVVKTELNKFITELKYDVLENIYDLRRLILNMQMANVQESLYMKTTLNSIKKSIKQVKLRQKGEDIKIDQKDQLHFKKFT